jgi:DNA-binding response OmpR family regulator
VSNILIVEDQLTLIDNLIFFLKSHHHLVFDTRENDKDILKLVDDNLIDLILLDLSLPLKMEEPSTEVGFDLLKTLSCHRPALPVIILSARFTRENQDIALRHGASDFIDKRELSERMLIEKIEKLLPSRDSLEVWSSDKKFTLNPKDRSAKVDYVAIELTAAEFDILKHFLSNPNIVISKEDICRAYTPTSDRLLEHYGTDLGIRRSVDEKVDRHIANLRSTIAKATDIADTATFIETSYGRGFKFNGECN